MRSLSAVVLVALGWAGLIPSAPAEGIGKSSPLRIGMISTMFKDVKPQMVGVISKPFASLVEQQTGLKGELCVVPTTDDLRRQLLSGEIHLGVFHGFEFAWLRNRQPELQPLMLAANMPQQMRVQLVVHANATTKGFCDLKGKNIAFATGSREHSRLWLERQCPRHGGDMAATVQDVANVEDALDAVVDGKVDAAVVEQGAMNSFQGRKPGRFPKLKVLADSESFPNSVIVYRHGGMGDEQLSKFREGMATAHKAGNGNYLLSMFRLKGFEKVPAGYDQVLEAFTKRYPAPDDFCR